MRIISARQAWHDAHYTPWDSVMSHCSEMLKLGTDVQRSEIDRTVGMAWHQVMAGKVQAAIKTLPIGLQCFGHRLYAPSPSDTECETAHMLVWSRFVFPQPVRAAKRERAFWMADCAIANHDRVVHGREAMTPEQIRAWLADERGVELSSQQWSREWLSIWDQFRTVCDRADAQCLAPVAQLIYTHDDEVKKVA
jgi:hypothetical protein